MVLSTIFVQFARCLNGHEVHVPPGTPRFLYAPFGFCEASLLFAPTGIQKQAAEN